MGAIAGGVVGGIASICLSALAVYHFRIRHHRRSQPTFETTEIIEPFQPTPISAPSHSPIPSQVGAWDAKVESRCIVAGLRDELLGSGAEVGQSNRPLNVENRPGSTVAPGASGGGGERDGDIREQMAGIQAELSRIRSLQLQHESRLGGEDAPPEYDESAR